jgi:hypothetical protein
MYCINIRNKKTLSQAVIWSHNEHSLRHTLERKGYKYHTPSDSFIGTDIIAHKPFESYINDSMIHASYVIPNK